MHKARRLLNVKEPAVKPPTLVEDKSPPQMTQVVFTCSKCSGSMIVTDVLISRLEPRAPSVTLVN